MSSDAENETPPMDEAASSGPASEPGAEQPAPVVEWPGAGTDARPHRVREITLLASDHRSPWPGRVIAGAVGAGLTVVALALRDTFLGRRASSPEPPPTLRRRMAAWLRGEDH